MAWPLRALVFGVLVCVSAWLLERALRGTRVPLRAIWCLAVLLSACVPLLALYQPQLWPDGLRPVTTVPGVNASAGVQTIAHDSFRASMPALLWGVLVVLCGARYAWGWMILWRARRRWGQGHCCGEAVLVSHDVGPALVGMLRPRIVVPAWLLRADRVRQHMALLHEREHARARDHWLLALMPLVVIVFPWNLPLWWQLRRLRLAIELDCDRRVLACGVQSSAYGTMLLDIAAGTHLARAAALAEPRSLLSHRIAALGMRRLSPVTRAALIACTLAALLLGTVVTAPALVRVMAPVVMAPGARTTSATVVVAVPAVPVRAPGKRPRNSARNADATTLPHAPLAQIVATPLPAPLRMRAEQLRPRVQVRAQTAAPAAPKPLFVVDGVIVSSEASDEMLGQNAENIAAIEIVKGAAAERLYGAHAANGVISITTKNRTHR